jgi:hypothetical protein
MSNNDESKYTKNTQGMKVNASPAAGLAEGKAVPASALGATFRPAKRRTANEKVTYFLECKSCGGEMEIGEWPRGNSHAVAFSGAFNLAIQCRETGKVHEYSHKDIKDRTQKKGAETPEG